ncbi:DUF5671 domain-containing protein [Arenibacterium sp. CAU 1754]
MSAKQDLGQFVRDALIAGKDRASIRDALASSGWTKSEVDQAMDGWADTDFTPPVPRPQAVVSARDFFVYALTFGALIFAASYLVVLFHQLIDIMFEDSPGHWQRNNMRWAMSVLIVSAPLYLWLTLRERAKLAVDPALYRSSIRKWMIYLALLAAAATLLGDLVYVIYTFLKGDVTAQFLLKALAVAVVAGGIFLYYLSDIRKGDSA